MHYLHLRNKHIFFWPSMWHVEFAQPGIEPMPPVLEAQNLNHWITRLSPRNKHIKKKKKITAQKL